MKTNSDLTRVSDYIKETLPWAHGHQLKGLTTFAHAIFEEQTGCQAQLARTQGNQEAACKRLSRLIHNPRLAPKRLAESIAHKALSQVPATRKVRITIDWTTEDDQHLLVISLVIGRRGIPIYWRAYHQSESPRDSRRLQNLRELTEMGDFLTIVICKIKSVILHNRHPEKSGKWR